jgi:hypothetical protein
MNKDVQTLTFTTTVIGDHVRLGDDEFVITQKFTTERRLMLRPVGRQTAVSRSMGEFEYNASVPVLVKAAEG